MNSDELVQDYFPLVKSIALTYVKYGMPLEDLIQEGMLGLLAASQRYEPDQETKFSTYATFWIKKYILAAINDEYKYSHLHNPLSENKVSSIEQTINTADEDLLETKPKISLPPNIPDLEAKILYLSYEKKLTIKQIAVKLNLTCERVRQLRQKALRRMKHASNI